MRTAVCAAALLSVCAIRPASAGLIDFETGDVSWPCHAHYNTYSSGGVSFGSFPFPVGPMSGWPCVRLVPSANGTRGLQGYNPLRGALSLWASFQDGGGALEVVADVGIPVPLPGAGVRMDGFDAFGTIVDTEFAYLDVANRELGLSLWSATPIVRVEFNGFGSWFVLDNVSFEAAPVADVPAQGGAALLAAGLALAGRRLRRAA